MCSARPGEYFTLFEFGQRAKQLSNHASPCGGSVNDATVEAIGAERVGIRLSPYGRYNEMPPFKDEAETYLTLAKELALRKIAYVHFSDQTKWVEDISIPKNYLKEFRRAFGGTLILTGGYLRENGPSHHRCKRGRSHCDR